MSLRDQLLKAGLVSKKQIQKTEAVNRKQEHDSKKNQDLAKKLEQEKQQELATIAQEQQERRDLDKELNKQRDALMQEREGLYRAQQLLTSRSLNERDATQPYYFLEKTFVRKIMVTVWQKELLARGKLGIGRPLDDIDEFVIVTKDVGKTILDICPNKLLLLHSELSDTDDIDDRL